MEVLLVVTAAILCLSSNLVLATSQGKLTFEYSAEAARKRMISDLLYRVPKDEWQYYVVEKREVFPTHDEIFDVAVEELMSIKSDREADRIMKNLLDYFEVTKLRSKVLAGLESRLADPHLTADFRSKLNEKEKASKSPTVQPGLFVPEPEPRPKTEHEPSSVTTTSCYAVL